MTNLELEKMIEAERANLRAVVLEQGYQLDRRMKLPNRGPKLEAWERREEKLENQALEIVERIETLRAVLRA